MPKKKRSKRNGSMTKSDFVRSLPAGTPAKEVAARAAKHGMKISEKYVYVIRSNDKAHAGGSRSRGRRGRATGASAGSEAQLRKTIAELGLSRARKVFQEVEAAFA